MHHAYIRRYTLLQYGVTHVSTFDQLHWMKAHYILDAENIVLCLGGFYMEMSFLASIGLIMTETG